MSALSNLRGDQLSPVAYVPVINETLMPVSPMREWIQSIKDFANDGLLALDECVSQCWTICSQTETTCKHELVDVVPLIELDLLNDTGSLELQFQIEIWQPKRSTRHVIRETYVLSVYTIEFRGYGEFWINCTLECSSTIDADSMTVTNIQVNRSHQ